jgi:signal transduction histidine kinase
MGDRLQIGNGEWRMSFYISAFLSLLLLAMLFKRYQESMRIKKMCETIEEIRLGNRNLRFRGTVSGSLRELSVLLNLLMDEFQETTRKAIFYEESRKRITSNISHDLQTPLAALLGYVEALMMDGSLTEQDKKAFLQIVFDKGKKLSRLFKEFFELAKFESNDEIMKLEKINISESIHEVFTMFNQECNLKKVSIQLNMPQAPLFVWGDTNFIERILHNLISNAIRYGSSGHIIGAELKEENEWIVIEIWDHGKGIQHSDLPFIFERLFTGKDSRNSVLQGSGLGLTITKTLVEKLRGNITVSSIPGKKTVFTVALLKA